MKNILFVAAHPDDELVGATFIIKKLLQKKNIIIFFLTNGVISKEEMWFWNKNKYK
jgi:LmbE family N-acetylglucosaminyl deacetylase